MENDFQGLNLANEYVVDVEPQEDNELSIIKQRETGNINGTALVNGGSNFWQPQNDGTENHLFQRSSGTEESCLSEQDHLEEEKIFEASNNNYNGVEYGSQIYNRSYNLAEETKSDYSGTQAQLSTKKRPNKKCSQVRDKVQDMFVEDVGDQQNVQNHVFTSASKKIKKSSGKNSFLNEYKTRPKKYQCQFCKKSFRQA